MAKEDMLQSKDKIHPVIGLEVHMEQNTNSKMFCACPASHFGVKPNTNTCPVCLGLPGAMPFANEQAIINTVKLGMALGCRINNSSKFDRKHYYYPDLPKGYQISQYDLPLCSEGSLMGIGIRRVHLEEDTGKMVHSEIDGGKVSLVDYNRSGVPLIELVSEPGFDSSERVDSFLKEVRLIIRYLGISDADMEKGSLRLEANVSVGRGSELPNYKVELKNINSFKFLKKAIEIEIERQTELVEAGKKVRQETRGYDQDTNTTFSQRAKENEQDYRYFPEPDIYGFRINKSDFGEHEIELPQEKRIRIAKEYGLSEEYVEILVGDLSRVQYFERAAKLGMRKNLSANLIAGLMINQNMDKSQTEAELVGKLLEIEKKDYAKAPAIDKAIEKVIGESEKAVKDYRNGKEQVIGYLIGQVQKELKGRGDIETIRAELINKIR